MADAHSAVPLAVLLLGDTRDPEMAPIASLLSERAGNAVRVVADADRACELISTEAWHPDLIVVLQTWSDQFPATEILQLLSLTPLARIVCAAGAWCDSDSRTRSSWPIAARIRAVDALARIECEIAGLRSASKNEDEIGCESSGFLPLTASRAEVFGADLIDGLPISIDGSCVVVRSPDRAWTRMIESALGILSSSSGRTELPVIAVVDVDPWNECARELLRDARTDWPDARIVACSGYFAADHRDELLSTGADSVWFKLSPLASLNRCCCEPLA